MKCVLGKTIIAILNLIKQNGYKAYVVGGYIRDLLLNIENKDIDIATDATPENIKKILKEYELEDEFAKLGSIKFKLDGYNFEVTTFRKEFNYINHRRPSKVEFVSTLDEDLSRRDFTINAICSDGEELVDIYEGISDLQKEIIKTVGDPCARFEEDCLRILRAFRFSSKLGFSLDKQVENAAENNYSYLNEVNFDTKYRELKGILQGKQYLVVIKKYQEILRKIFHLNELRADRFNNYMNYEEREALFFYYSDIKINNKYLENKKLQFSMDKVAMKKQLMKYGKDNIYNILYFRSSILKEDIRQFELLKEIIENNECYNLKMLDINGEDLLNINIENNKIGRYLEQLLNAVIENKCLNKKKELLKYLKIIY